MTEILMFLPSWSPQLLVSDKKGGLCLWDHAAHNQLPGKERKSANKKQGLGPRGATTHSAREKGGLHHGPVKFGTKPMSALGSPS